MIHRQLLVALCLTAILVTSAFAQDQIIKQDPVFTDRWNIYENGRQIGEVKPDPIFPDRYNVYDKDGKKTGVWKKNPAGGKYVGNQRTK